MNVVIHTYSMRDEKWFPRSITIPPDKEQAFRQQAQNNHSQTVEGLNGRGGMSPIEIYWAYNRLRLEFGTVGSRELNMKALQLCIDLAADKKERP